jgi:hypothetical protein
MGRRGTDRRIVVCRHWSVGLDVSFGGGRPFWAACWCCGGLGHFRSDCLLGVVSSETLQRLARSGDCLVCSSDRCFSLCNGLTMRSEPGGGVAVAMDSRNGMRSFRLGLKARDVTARGEAPGTYSPNQPLRPVRAGYCAHLWGGLPGLGGFLGWLVTRPFWPGCHRSGL